MTRAFNLRKNSKVLLVAVAALLPSSLARSEDFYANKTLTILVGSSVSSGFATYSQLIGPYMRKHLPGNPTVVVRAMPGAGGSTAALHVFRIAPKDGTLMATLTPNALMDKAFGTRVQVDPVQFGYVGGAQRAVRICFVSGDAPATTFKDAQATKLLMGSTQVGSLTSDYNNMLMRAAGAKFHTVLGYEGPGALYLSAERGETHGACGLEWSAFKSTKSDMLRLGKLKILLQIGAAPVDELTKLGAPHAWDVINSADDLAAMKLYVNFQELLGKAYVTPPDTPPERLADLRKAFEAAIRDPDLLAQAAKMKLDIDVISGDEIKGAVEALYTAKPETLKRLIDLVAEPK